MYFVRNLMDFDEAQLDAWLLPEKGDMDLMDEAYFSNCPQIRAQFLYLKRTSSFWS